MIESPISAPTSPVVANDGKSIKLPLPSPSSKEPLLHAGDTIKCVDNDVLDEVNSWSPIKASTFNIRSSGYSEKKLKQPSAEALCETICCDLYQTSNPIFDMHTKFNLPTPKYGSGNTAGVPHTVIFTGLHPAYPPSLFTYNIPAEKIGHQLMLVSFLTENTLKQLRGEIEMTPAVALLRDFCLTLNDVETTNRMKLIPMIANPETSLSKVGYASSRIIKSYNGTPVLTRPEHRITATDEVLNIEVNAHDFKYLTRTSMHAVHGQMPDFCIDMGLIIQGHTEEELPEAILLCARFNHLNNSPSQVMLK